MSSEKKGLVTNWWLFKKKSQTSSFEACFKLSCLSEGCLRTHTYSTCSYISIFQIKSGDRNRKNSSVKEIKGQKKRKGRDRDVQLQSKTVSAVFSTVCDTVRFHSTHNPTHSIVAFWCNFYRLVDSDTIVICKHPFNVNCQMLIHLTTMYF